MGASHEPKEDSAAARSLGVSTQQLSTALMHAKQSMAGGS
jgi:hypothetical protein